MNMYTSLDSNVILYPGQRLERHTALPVSEEMKSGMDIVPFYFIEINKQIDGGKKKLDNTLVGKIIEILRNPSILFSSIGQEGRPLSRDEIQRKIGEDFNDLRKSDGTKYKGDRLKALNGALYSTGIFHREGDLWSIREEEIESYERKTRIKLETKGKRKRVSTCNSLA